MTASLWGSGIRRETYKHGKPATVERFKTRPWPVDPRQYPLSGPSSGLTALPPDVWRLVRICLIIGALTYALGFMVGLVIGTVRWLLGQ